jgi:hypothetical protein
MTSDEIKSAITAWCGEGTGLQLVEDRSEPGADFVLGLRVSTSGSAGTVPVEARLDQGGDRVTVSSASSGSSGGAAVSKLIESRPASVRTEDTGGGTAVTGQVFTDGFSRQAFMGVIAEVAKTRGLVDALSGDRLGGQPYTAAASSSSSEQPWAAAAQPEPAASFGAAGSSLPSPSFGGAAAQPSYTPLSGQPAQQPHPASTAFAPTHTVPPQGMQAWAAPDPNGAVVATLGGGLPIQITEVRGAWAHVLCSNGWTGWVDGRIIGVAR